MQFRYASMETDFLSVSVVTSPNVFSCCFFKHSFEPYTNSEIYLLLGPHSIIRAWLGGLEYLTEKRVVHAKLRIKKI